jgi:hypothetical protein
MNETTQEHEHPTQPTEGPTEEYAFTGADTAAGSGSEGDDEASRARAKEWLAQLEQMIESLATQAAPVIRQVGAKAAELAALAAEKAGPIAHRAAELTEVAGAKVAERSRHLAEELRGERETRGGGDGSGAGGTEGGATSESGEGGERPA